MKSSNKIISILLLFFITFSVNAQFKFDNIVSTDVTDCYGGSDGTITVFVSGGTPPYQYSLDGTTFQPGNVFNGLTSGAYTVFAKDFFQTIISPGPEYIDQPTEIHIDSENYTDVTGCFGDTDGTITVVATGGTGTLSYSIDNGGSYPYTCGNTVGSLGAGTYNIKVRDANMCIKNGSALTIGQPLELLITGEDVTDVLGCFGDDNGTIDITTTGGTAPIQYSIDNGSTFHSGHYFAPLAPGNYPVVVMDDNSCITNGSTLTVSGPDIVTIDSENWTHVTLCFGDHNGTITIVASGGTGQLYYSIDGGVNWENNGNFNNLFAGTYNVVVRDQSLCTVTGSTIIIDEPAQIVIDSEFKTDVTTCFGDATGQIIINAHGGIAPLEYSITGGAPYFANGGVFNGVVAGTYNTQIIDANLCTVNGQSHLISQPMQLLISDVTTTNVSICFGGSNGEIHFETNGGGTSPYNFSIDGGVTYPHGYDVTGLSAGIYDVYVRDSHNCIHHYTDEVVEIGEPEEIIITSEVPTDPICYGDENGSITVTATGGSGEFEYSPNAGANYYEGNILVELSVAGNPHIIWVRDKYNHTCVTVGGSHNLVQPDELVIDSLDVENVSDCFGGTNGSITIYASGGTLPILYSITGGNTYTSTHVFNNLSIGNYPVIIKDANDCTTVGDIVTISQPDILEVTFQSHVDIQGCHGDLIGEIHIDAIGGTPFEEPPFPSVDGYQYSVNGGTDYYYNDGDFTGLPAGTYNIVVQDSIGCLAYGNDITIKEPAVLILELDTAINVNCYGNASGYIRLKQPTGGQPNFVYSIDGGVTYNEDGSNVFYNLIAGDYETYVKDLYGCEVAGPLVTITQPYLLSIDAVNVTNVDDCYGDNDGIIEISVSGGVTDYMYSIDNGDSYYDNNGFFTNLEPGNYYVRVYDSNYCEAFLDLDGNSLIDTIEITEPPRLIITDITETHISCFGDNDGTIEVTASGGTGDFHYSIYNGDDNYPSVSGYFTGLAHGTYMVKVRDDSLCTSDAYPANIYEPDELIIDTVYVTDEECPGYNNGSVNIFIEGGTSPFLYRVLEGEPYQSNKIISDLAPGDYTPAVSDANGCTATYPVVTIEAAEYSGLFTTDVSEGCSPLEVLFTRLSPGFTYLWDFGDGETSNAEDSAVHVFYNTTLNPVVYTVTVYSASPNYCLDTTYTDITVYPQPQLNFTLNPDTAYYPESTVTITNNSPAGYVNYYWDLGDGTSSTAENPETHYYDDCGEYTIVMSADNTWCSGTIEQIYVVTAHQPEAMFVVDTMQSCVPVTINFENQSVYYNTFEWNLGDGTVTDENVFSHTYDTPGTYNVTINTVGYCDTYDSYTIPITVFQSPVVDFDVSPDTVMLPGQPIHCYNSSSEDSDLFFWEFGDGGTSNEENPIYQYTEPGSYYISLTVTSVNKCIDSLIMFTEVIVLPAGEVVFPNAFTPDGDGDNDEFKPAYYNSVKTFKMEIYNRWGERMFLTNDINVGWNGYIDGAISLQDVYVWRAEGVYLNGTPYILSGSLTLLR
ncbi:MAG: PKD domain-containing protein [Bacteroidales bacterium]|nr:PKD domain-containing protein [Bacteroidales bacterium]